MPEYRYQSGDVAFSLIGSILSLAGYWIWIGWGFYLKTGRYPLTSKRQFWSVSLVIHSLWAFAIPYGIIVFVREDLSSYAQTFTEFWREGQNLPFRSWIAFNILVAVFAIWNGRSSQKRPCIKAEQAGDGDAGDAV